MRHPSQTRRWLFAGLAIVGTTVSLVLLYPLLNEYVIQPAGFFLWAVWKTISSIHQRFYWGALIFLGVVVILRLAAADEDRAFRSAYGKEKKAPGPLERWKTRIEAASLGGEELHRALAALYELNGALDERLGSTSEPPMSHSDPDHMLPSILYTESKSTNFSIKQPDLMQMAMKLGLPRWLRKSLRIIQRPDLAWVDKTLTEIEIGMDIHDGKEKPQDS